MSFYFQIKICKINLKAIYGPIYSWLKPFFQFWECGRAKIHSEASQHLAGPDLEAQKVEPRSSFKPKQKKVQKSS